MKFLFVTRKKYDIAIKNAKLINDERKKVADKNKLLQEEVKKLNEEIAALKKQITEIDKNDIKRFKIRKCMKCKKTVIVPKNSSGYLICNECKEKNLKNKENNKNGRK